MQKWIFDDPEKLTLENVTRNLIKENISYKLTFLTLPNGYNTAAIDVTESKVKFDFALPEYEDEDYKFYLQRIQRTESNLFLLSSINLMA